MDSSLPYNKYYLDHPGGVSVEMNVAIIPARGGSKRIPRKNIKPFQGKPIIVWSIEAAVKAQCFDKIIVSTDDDEIARIATEHGAIVPFRRPEHLSNDYATTIDVARHAISWLQEKNKRKLKKVCLIYATCPFVQPNDIKAGMELADETHFSFPVTTFPFPIQRAIKIGEDHKGSMFQPEFFTTRSQDLEEAYHDTGQFYCGFADLWLNDTVVIFNSCKPLVIPRWRVTDIDTPEDWMYAEVMYQNLRSLGRI